MGADNPGWMPPEAGAVRALPVALTLMDQARARKHDTDLGNRLTGQAFGLLGRDAVLTDNGLQDVGKEPDCEDRGARRVREDPAAPVNRAGEMCAAGLMEPEEGSAGIVHTSGVPGAK